MKSLRDYIAESEAIAVGDSFTIEFDSNTLIESHVVEVTDDGVVIAGNDDTFKILESYGCKTETIRRYGAVGSSSGMGYTLSEQPVEEHGGGIGPAKHWQDVEEEHDPVDRIMELAGLAQPVDEDEGAGQLAAKTLELEPTGPTSGVLDETDVDEAEYHGHEVPLNKPMQGDVKKSKVYVKNAKGNVVKVNFGDPNMRIKKSSPAHRRSFRARHHCENPGPKTSARYWSCRAW